MSATHDKRALVTGATGFIGRHLVRRLLADGCQTHAIVRPQSNIAPLQQLLGADHVHIHDGTIENMLALVGATRPTTIFHLASLFLAQHQSRDIPALVRSNVEFGAQLAEAAAVHKVPHFINTGTAWQHFADEPYNPVNLYAATKQALADILRYYAQAGDFRVTNLELFDTYGPGDTRPKLFATLQQAAVTGQTLAMSGGEQLIDLVYVDDVVEAYLAAERAGGEEEGTFETYAVSSGNPLPLREVVALWQRVTGQAIHVDWGARPYRPREVMRPWSGGKTVPGWQPYIHLEEGLQRIARKVQE